MIVTKCNYRGTYKNNLKCELCKVEDDTIEHLFNCKVIFPEKSKITSHDIEKSNTDIIKFLKIAIQKREQLGYRILVGDP
jgi:hypothetical protein